MTMPLIPLTSEEGPLKVEQSYGTKDVSLEMRMTCHSPDNTLAFRCSLIDSHLWKLLTNSTTFVQLEACLETNTYPRARLWKLTQVLPPFVSPPTESDYHDRLRAFILECRGHLFFEGYTLNGTYEYDGQTWSIPVFESEQAPRLELPSSLEDGPLGHC